MLTQNRIITAMQPTEEYAMSDDGKTLPAHPKSLQGHTIPKERLELIPPVIAALSETVLKVGDTLPLGADAADFVRVLETEGK